MEMYVEGVSTRIVHDSRNLLGMVEAVHPALLLVGSRMALVVILNSRNRYPRRS
jgi:hypothetical protein